jgi:serine/threonine protein kinase
MHDQHDCPHSQVRLCGDELPPGTMLGDQYLVLRRIAATGLSTVYYGVDQRSGGAVAIKRLSNAARPGDLSRASAVRGFEAEARLLQTVEHPQVPRLRASLRRDSDYLMVTDYVAGTTLDALLGTGTLTTSQAWGIAGRLCDAVVALHRQEPPVIHADIKPNNLIVGPAGDVMLLDFGLARRRGEPPPLDEAMGTPPYTPPEQWAGQALDERADVYALGMVLEELFAAVGITALCRVLARATAPERDERLASAGALRDAIDVAIALEDERRRPRSPIIIDLWTILALLAMLSVVGVMFLH